MSKIPLVRSSKARNTKRFFLLQRKVCMKFSIVLLKNAQKQLKIGSRRGGIKLSRRVNFDDNPVPRYPMNIGLDFSRADVVNDPMNNGDAEFIVFKETKPIKNKVTTGTYISQKSLKKIVTSDKTNGFYRIIDLIRKNDSFKKKLLEDFDLLRDFFPAELVLEVENYCVELFPKLEERLDSFTPRKRRTYIIAIFRSFCRRNGRKITKDFLCEINNRFLYKRTVKYLDVCRAESELIDLKLLPRKEDTLEKDDLQIFYLNVINNINRLKQQKDISSNKKYLKIISLAHKYITSFAKENKEILHAFIKHQDKDFIARLTIWSIAKHFAKEKFNLKFIRVEELPGWNTLFLIERVNDIDSLQVPIRSLKYIFWYEFQFRNNLEKIGLLPEGK